MGTDAGVVSNHVLTAEEEKEVSALGFSPNHRRVHHSDHYGDLHAIVFWQYDPDKANVAFVWGRGMRGWVAMNVVKPTSWDEIYSWMNTGKYHETPTAALVEYRLQCGGEVTING